MYKINYGTVIPPSPVVHTTLGDVKGENRDCVAVFRGIPYGGSCSGTHRFLPPIPADSWVGVRDCTHNGPVAMQYGGSISGGDVFGPYFTGGKPELFGCQDEFPDEDCLVLNVVTPGLDKKARPVVVYLHGGGFATGSGTLVLGSDQWAREEDIVIVGINHRLNVFGYLHLGTFDERYAQSGLAGMLDCVLALEWVRDNIAAFGGDPGKVTIMGESGGGMKVNTLLAMERAKGLFRSAIVESGSGAPGTTGPETAAKQAQALLDVLGIPNNRLDLLAEVSKADILRASNKVPGGFGPCADGIDLLYNAEGSFVEIDPTKPLMVGSSEDEMAAWAVPSPDGMTWEEVREKLVSGNPRSSMDEKTADKLIACFRELDNGETSPEHMYFRIMSMNGMLGGGAYRQVLARAARKEGSVYHYFITFDAPNPANPDFRFAWHTADLPLQMRVVLHPCCEAISQTMAHAWAAFIRSGSPVTDELAWPAFTAEEPWAMVFDEPSRAELDPTKPYRDIMDKMKK